MSAPPPFGGSQRTVVVRADPERLRSYPISPDELITALTDGNTISPSGNVRIGKMMPIVPINSLVRDVKELENIPIRIGENPAVYLRDVATVQDATDIPAGYALVNGRRAVYILVTKRADASTLSVVSNVKEALPKMQAVLPDDIKVSFEFDQSSTVTGAVRSLAIEGASGAILTGLMVLVFLRDWRSVIVVVLNIPFAICGALVALWLTGQTMNLMTLGGLALSIGILVDEATVEIENIHHKMEETESVASAVRLGNMDTAVPRLLAMLCILAVFLPSFFMQGAAQALFVPLVAGRRVCDGLLLPAFEHVRAGALRLAARDAAPECKMSVVRTLIVRAAAYGAVPVARGAVSMAGRAGVPRAGRRRHRRPGDEPWAGDFSEGGRRPVPASDARPTGTRIEETEKLAPACSRRSTKRSGADQMSRSPRLHRADSLELPDQRHLSVDRRARGNGAPRGPEERLDRRRRGPQGAASARCSRRRCRRCGFRSSRQTSSAR